MKKQAFVNELREGHAWKYADGLCYSEGMKHSDKSKATDWDLIKAASTCSTCNRSASNEEIEEAIEFAHDYESFAKEIGQYIEHASDCIVEIDDDEDE